VVRWRPRGWRYLGGAAYEPACFEAVGGADLLQEAAGVAGLDGFAERGVVSGEVEGLSGVADAQGPRVELVGAQHGGRIGLGDALEEWVAGAVAQRAGGDGLGGADDLVDAWSAAADRGAVREHAGPAPSKRGPSRPGAFPGGLGPGMALAAFCCFLAWARW
jgi:hypothetical protein